MYLILLLFCAIITSAQPVLKENKTDEFTGARIASTSWEILSKKSPYLYFRLRMVNEVYLLDIKSYAQHTIAKDDKLMLKFSNDSIVTLNAMETSIPCIGCGSYNLVGSAALGVENTYELSHENLIFIAKTLLVKTRLYTVSGYLDMEVKYQAAEDLQTAIRLVVKASTE